MFFPHGLGHRVGLGVRAGSGLAPGRTKDPRPCLRTLRMDLPLAVGYVVTIEPGLYFIPPRSTIRRDANVSTTASIGRWPNSIATSAACASKTISS